MLRHRSTGERVQRFDPPPPLCRWGVSASLGKKRPRPTAHKSFCAVENPEKVRWGRQTKGRSTYNVISGAGVEGCRVQHPTPLSALYTLCFEGGGGAPGAPPPLPLYQRLSTGCQSARVAAHPTRSAWRWSLSACDPMLSAQAADPSSPAVSPQNAGSHGA